MISLKADGLIIAVCSKECTIKSSILNPKSSILNPRIKSLNPLYRPYHAPLSMIRACDVLPRAARVNESKKGRYHSIIRSHLRNLTQRAISKAHGVNRRTVAAAIKRVQAGLSLTPTLNTGKRYADRLLSPPLVAMLEAIYEEKPDMFLDEAVAALQLKSTKPL